MKKTVLIAEDDKAILEVVKLILENDGYNTVSSDNEEEIHNIIKKEPPHLILLDIWLSGYDGGEIARDLKHSDKTKHIPIIMISANNETQKITKEVGADGFLLKPFDIDDLLKIVKKHIKE